MDEHQKKETRTSAFLKEALVCMSWLTRVCLANQVGGEEAAEKPFLEERRCTSEANEKMVLEPLAYSSDTPLGACYTFALPLM
jgi:hypothetical protein